MKTFSIVAVLLFSLPMVTHASENVRTSDYAILRTTVSGLTMDNPAHDAKQNFEHGDKRFIAVCDYSCHAPGREGIALEAFVRSYGMRRLDGTTDTPEGDEHSDLIRKVSQYGIEYNRELAALLSQSK